LVLFALPLALALALGLGRRRPPLAMAPPRTRPKDGSLSRNARERKKEKREISLPSRDPGEKRSSSAEAGWRGAFPRSRADVATAGRGGRTPLVGRIAVSPLRPTPVGARLWRVQREGLHGVFVTQGGGARSRRRHQDLMTRVV